MTYPKSVAQGGTVPVRLQLSDIQIIFPALSYAVELAIMSCLTLRTAIMSLHGCSKILCFLPKHAM